MSWPAGTEPGLYKQIAVMIRYSIFCVSLELMKMTLIFFNQNQLGAGGGGKHFSGSHLSATLHSTVLTDLSFISYTQISNGLHIK